jgi:large conductance mechanosensitive channel
MLKEFKEFLLKGNAVDMAVGFMFGAAFASIVKSLVENLIMPPVGLLMGGVDFSNKFFALDGNEYASLEALEKAGAPAIKYGLFVNDTIAFLILGFVIFMLVRTLNKMQNKKDEAPTTKNCPDCAMEIPIEAHKCAYCQRAQ